jgi:hypothetical protein
MYFEYLFRVTSIKYENEKITIENFFRYRKLNEVFKKAKSPIIVGLFLCCGGGTPTAFCGEESKL